MLNPNLCVKLVKVSKVCPEISAANPNVPLRSRKDWFSFLLVIKTSLERIACFSNSREIPLASDLVNPKAFCKSVILLLADCIDFSIKVKTTAGSSRPSLKLLAVNSIAFLKDWN